MLADTTWVATKVSHGVISVCCDNVFSSKNIPDYTLTFLASWGVTQIHQLALGHISPGPVEHKMAVGSGIEAMVGI